MSEHQVFICDSPRTFTPPDEITAPIVSEQLDQWLTPDQPHSEGDSRP